MQNSANYNVAAVNMSLGSGNMTSNVSDSYCLADEYEQLDNLKIITTVAAGNSGATYDTDGINTLAASDRVIAVSAVNNNNTFTDFTQKHADLTDISALGEDVNINGYSLSGISFSAPIVAGTAAIIQQIAVEKLGHKITDEQFLDLIQKSADQIDPSTYSITQSNNNQSTTETTIKMLDNNPEHISPITDPGHTWVDAHSTHSYGNNFVIKDTLGYADEKDYYSFTLDNDAMVNRLRRGC